MNDKLFSVEDLVTLVSGASRGIGYALAHGFAERGAQVIITARKQETLSEAASKLSEATGNTVEAMVCDVADVEQIRTVVAQIINKYGRIDTLLNVAGVNIRRPAEQFSQEEYDFIMNINLRGAFFMATEVGKYMIKQGKGTQVNIESYNTFAPLKGVLPYAMSKFGMKGMTRGLASEWGPYGVRVNGIGPGFILTALNRELWADPTMKEWGIENTPLRRLGEVEDIVGTAIYFASDASAFVTGQTIYVDGGVSAGTLWPIKL